MSTNHLTVDIDNQRKARPCCPRSRGLVQIAHSNWLLAKGPNIKTRDRPKHTKTRTLGSNSMNSMKQSTWHCIGNMCSRNGAVAEAVWVSEFLSALLHAAKNHLVFTSFAFTLRQGASTWARPACLFIFTCWFWVREELHLRKSSFKYSTGVIMSRTLQHNRDFSWAGQFLFVCYVLFISILFLFACLCQRG